MTIHLVPNTGIQKHFRFGGPWFKPKTIMLVAIIRYRSERKARSKGYYPSFDECKAATIAKLEAEISEHQKTIESLKAMKVEDVMEY